MSAHEMHNADTDHSGELKSTTAFRSSFWFVIILVGLFIAALNFVRVMGDSKHEGEGGHEGHATEQHDAVEHGAQPEHVPTGTPASEHEHAEEAATAPVTNSDTTAGGAQH